jgi:hypothetical protein
MKLFGQRQWIISIIGLVGGLLLSSYVLKMKYGEINPWIIISVGIIGLLILITLSKYANKEK